MRLIGSPARRSALLSGVLQRFFDSCRSFRQVLRYGWFKLQVLMLLLLAAAAAAAAVVVVAVVIIIATTATTTTSAFCNLSAPDELFPSNTPF
jgi:hypothetical protein